MGQIESKSFKEAINHWRKKNNDPASRREFVCVSSSVAQNTSESGEMQIWEDYEESK